MAETICNLHSACLLMTPKQDDSTVDRRLCSYGKEFTIKSSVYMYIVDTAGLKQDSSFFFSIDLDVAEDHYIEKQIARTTW